MGKIIELNQQVSNQIAAGEVVERPSSVIKELVENSLDAGARNIEVRIKNGGFSYLIVQDDGMGMDEADVKLAIKRYATSKLCAVSDLDRLQTFGFRGEALPSIASISQMSIISRPPSEPHGNKAIVDAGVIREFTKAGAAVGTRIEVRDLFYNVPARLKFAKSKRVEASEIDRLLRAFAFMHQDIGFRFFIDDSLVFSYTPKTDSEFQRALSLLGNDNKGLLYPIHKDTGLLTIEGVIGAPMAQRRDTRGMVFFVNNRLVSDKKLLIAVKAAFRSLIEVGYHPVCALKIGIAPDEIDVNVHPRKTEVRFRDDKAVVSQVINELSLFLSDTPWLSLGPALRAPVGTPGPIGFQSRPHHATHGFDFLLKREREPSMPLADFTSVRGNWSPPVLPKQSLQTRLLSAANFSSLRIIGQVCSTYLLAQSEEGLVVIDQHAAHERVMYEKIRGRKELRASSSPLLVPISIDIDVSSMALFEEHKSEFTNLGIDAEKFGEGTIVIRMLPDFIKNIDVVPLINDILSDLSQHGHATAVDEIFHHLCATLACHSSIRAGQSLSKAEIETLLIELDGTDFGAHCPHGRPIVKSFPASVMKKWFDRT